MTWSCADEPPSSAPPPQPSLSSLPARQGPAGLGERNPVVGSMPAQGPPEPGLLDSHVGSGASIPLAGSSQDPVLGRHASSLNTKWLGPAGLSGQGCFVGTLCGWALPSGQGRLAPVGCSRSVAREQPVRPLWSSLGPTEPDGQRAALHSAWVGLSSPQGVSTPGRQPDLPKVTQLPSSRPGLRLTTTCRPTQPGSSLSGVTVSGLQVSVCENG